jgi:hypothetical protein
VGSGAGVTRARQAREGRDADRDLDLAAGLRRDAQPGLERRREVGSGRGPWIRSDRVCAGSGARRGGGGPDGVAGERCLPGGGEQDREDREQGDELDRRLAVLIAESPHASSLACGATRNYAEMLRFCAETVTRPEIR